MKQKKNDFLLFELKKNMGVSLSTATHPAKKKAQIYFHPSSLHNLLFAQRDLSHTHRFSHIHYISAARIPSENTDP